MRWLFHTSFASMLLLQGCGLASGFGTPPASSDSRLGALSAGATSVDLSTAYRDAVSALIQQHPGTTPRLTSVSNPDLDREGDALGGDGWLLDFIIASNSYGVQVKADGSTSTFGAGGYLHAPFDLSGVAAGRLISMAYPDQSQDGPFGISLETDSEGNGPVALVGLGGVPSQAIWAKTGQPYAPIRPVVAWHLVNDMQRVLGAAWDTTFDPAGAPTVAVASLVTEGALNPMQAKALDPSGTGRLDRAAYISMANWPEALFQYDAFLGNSFHYVTGESGFMTPAQSSFDASFGQKVDPGQPPPPPVLFHVTISAAAFAAADQDTDGRLSLTEAMVPLADAIADAILASPEALSQGASFTADALPWAHF